MKKKESEDFDAALESSNDTRFELNHDKVLVKTTMSENPKIYELNDLGLALRVELSNKAFLELLKKNLFSLVKGGSWQHIF